VSVLPRAAGRLFLLDWELTMGPAVAANLVPSKPSVGSPLRGSAGVANVFFHPQNVSELLGETAGPGDD